MVSLVPRPVRRSSLRWDEHLQDRNHSVQSGAVCRPLYPRLRVFWQSVLAERAEKLKLGPERSTNGFEQRSRVPFYGRTPDEAAGLLTAWLKRAYRRVPGAGTIGEGQVQGVPGDQRRGRTADLSNTRPP